MGQSNPWPPQHHHHSILRAHQATNQTYSHAPYRTYSGTAARETHNLEEVCSNSLRATMISVWDAETEAWHRGGKSHRPGVYWSQI